MKIAHITSELCRKSAGLGTAVAGISSATESAGNEVRVFGLTSPEWEQGDNATWSGAPAKVFEPTRLSGPLGYAPEMLQSLMVFNPDIVHLHGLWTYPSIATQIWHRKTGRPYVVSAHGMLTSVALQYSRWRKFIARSMFQDGVLRAASMLHATSEDEKSSYLDLGFRNRIEIIPLGMDVLPRVNTDQARHGRRALFLGRLHHKKGIDWLIDAWIRLESDFPDWELSIVGPLEPSYTREIERMQQATSDKRVSFVGPLYGDDKQNYLANSELFVLPSRSENFGLTVPESLMMEVPVIATKGTPWSGLVNNNAGWWIELGSSALEANLRVAMALPRAELRRRGENGRRWIEQDFSWLVIGSQWHRMYNHIIKKKKSN